MKALFRLVLLLGVYLFSSYSHAIKYKSCTQKSFKYAKGWNATGSDLDALYGLGTSISSSTSTTSFVSSTGDCGAFAIFKAREDFIHNHYDQIRRDSARGSGEYLAATGILSGCISNPAQAKFQEVMRSEFERIYIDKVENSDSVRLSGQVDHLIQRHSTLREMCSTQVI